MKENIEANNVSEILKLVEGHFQPRTITTPFGLWFRGQKDYKFDLRPSIFRQGKDCYRKRIYEADLYREFLLLRNTQNYNYKTTFEWLILMQHYGLSTRLLDWSENLLVGLYFATEDDTIDGAFYVIEPLSLNHSSDQISGLKIYDHFSPQVILRANLSISEQIEDYLELEEVKKFINNNKINNKLTIDGKFEDHWFQSTIETPIAVRPPIQNDRIFLQHGVFTLHGGKIKGDQKIVEPIHIENLDDVGIWMMKIQIPKKSKSIIREELKYCGINEATLFPELEYQSRNILNKFSKF